MLEQVTEPGVPTELKNKPSEEKVRSTIEPIERSKSVLILQLLFVFLLLDGMYALVAIVLSFLVTPGMSVPVIIGLLVFHLLKTGVAIYLVMSITLRWSSTMYYVTGHHLVVREGIFSITEKLYELNNIRTVTVNESWLGRLLNFGDIILAISASSVREDVRLDSIADPAKYEVLFEKYLSEQGQ